MSSQYFWYFFPTPPPLCHSILLRSFARGGGLRGLESSLPPLDFEGSETEQKVIYLDNPKETGPRV